MKPPRLVTPRLILRMPVLEDAPAVVRYLKENRAHLAPWSPGFPTGFFTKPFWEERIRQASLEWKAETALRLYMFSRQDPTRVIGAINFTQIFRGPFQNAYLGYSIAASEQGKGLMTEGLRAAIAFVFRKMNLHRISANHMPTNIRSREVLRRLGFSVEGYARDYLLMNGVWEDHVLTTLVNPGWKNPEPATSSRATPVPRKARTPRKSGK